MFGQSERAIGAWEYIDVTKPGSTICHFTIVANSKVLPSVQMKLPSIGPDHVAQIFFMFVLPISKISGPATQVEIRALRKSQLVGRIWRSHRSPILGAVSLNSLRRTLNEHSDL